MSQLFFFILRDARESSIARYTGLLPKLSPELLDKQVQGDADEQLEDIIAALAEEQKAEEQGRSLGITSYPQRPPLADGQPRPNAARLSSTRGPRQSGAGRTTSSDQQRYNDEQLDSIIGKDYRGIISKKDQKDFFRKMLESPNNSLKKSRYLLKSDIDKIIQLNLELFDQTSMTKGEYQLFLDHLHLAHSDMEYGNYMGARKANSEKEFLESVDRANLTDKNQTLVFYINAENLIEYVDKVKDKHQIQSPLIYFNMGWQYGIIEEGSKRYFGDNFYDFMCYLRGLTNEQLLFSETIVQIPLPVDIFKHTFQKEGETFLTGGKKKTNKKKYSVKKKKSLKQKQLQRKKETEAKKYVDLLNLALQNIHSDINLVVFDKDDYLLFTSGFINTNINKGYKYINDKNKIKDTYCNSLCMTVSMLNFGLLEKPLKKFNMLEKLYLFFISYLQQERQSKPVPYEYALRKAEIIINNETKKFQTSLSNDGPDHRRTKQYMKNIKRLEKKKQSIIDQKDINIRDPGLYRFYSIDKCNNIDCEYLHSYHMEKSEKHRRSYEKFCNHIPFLFKGIVWLNMNAQFGGNPFGPNHGKKFSPYYIKKNKEILPLNINIRNTMAGPLKGKLIMIPTPDMCKMDMFYPDGEKKEDYFDKYGNQTDYWVFTDLNIKQKTIDMINIKKLKDQHFIAPVLWGDSSKEIIELMNHFVLGKSPLPKLKNIHKKTSVLGGTLKKDLHEEIENSITLHWVVVHNTMLKTHIQNMYEQF